MGRRQEASAPSLYRTLTPAAPPRSQPSLPDPPLLQGRPKGVEISHGGLRDLIAFFVEKMELGALTRGQGGCWACQWEGRQRLQPACMHTPASLQPTPPPSSHTSPRRPRRCVLPEHHSVL